MVVWIRADSNPETTPHPRRRYFEVVCAPRALNLVAKSDSICLMNDSSNVASTASCKALSGASVASLHAVAYKGHTVFHAAQDAPATFANFWRALDTRRTYV